MKPIDPPLNYLNYSPIVFNPPKAWDEDKDGKCLPIVGLRNDTAGEVCFFWKPDEQELEELLGGGSVELTLKYVGNPVVNPMSMSTVPRRNDERG